MRKRYFTSGLQRMEWFEHTEYRDFSTTSVRYSWTDKDEHSISISSYRYRSVSQNAYLQSHTVCLEPRSVLHTSLEIRFRKSADLTTLWFSVFETYSKDFATVYFWLSIYPSIIQYLVVKRTEDLWSKYTDPYLWRIQCKNYAPEIYVIWAPQDLNLRLAQGKARECAVASKGGVGRLFLFGWWIHVSSWKKSVNG